MCHQGSSGEFRDFRERLLHTLRQHSRLAPETGVTLVLSSLFRSALKPEIKDLEYKQKIEWEIAPLSDLQYFAGHFEKAFEQKQNKN